MTDPNDLVRELRIAEQHNLNLGRKVTAALFARAANELERVRAEKEVYMSKLATERDLRCKAEQRARDAEARRPAEPVWNKEWKEMGFRP